VLIEQVQEWVQSTQGLQRLEISGLEFLEQVGAVQAMQLHAPLSASAVDSLLPMGQAGQLTQEQFAIDTYWLAEHDGYPLVHCVGIGLRMGQVLQLPVPQPPLLLP
jgi:hypothetical protein